VISLGSTRR